MSNRLQPKSGTRLESLARPAWLPALGVLGLVSACTTMPIGPSVMALPGTSKNFDQFRADDYECRTFAQSQIEGATAERSAMESGIKSAAVGTAVGAVAGAAMGGQRDAGLGAGVGLLAGSLAGVGAAQTSGRTVQQRYDQSYIQCMYAKGEKVPVSAQTTEMPTTRGHGHHSSYAPAPSSYVEPTPPSYALPSPSSHPQPSLEHGTSSPSH